MQTKPVISVYISLDKKRAIRNAHVPLAIELPPFGQNDQPSYKFIVVRETGDPNNPTESVGTITSAVIALTDGDIKTYTQGTLLTYLNNTVQCILPIVSSDLDAILLVSRFVPTYLEIRVTINGEGELTVFNEQVSVVRSSHTPPDVISGTITFVDTPTIQWALG